MGDTPMLIHYNPNPTGQSKTDCVVRALSKALNKSWEEVYWDLCSEGENQGVWGDRLPVWSQYLKEHGFYRYVLPNTCPACYTVAEFARDHPRGIYVVATDAHVVTVVDGDVYDSWDSRQEVPVYYFVKEV